MASATENYILKSQLHEAQQSWL